jgi:tetratricopeptide (TPR) repeat protein
MSDPLRTDVPRVPEGAWDPDRDAKIEQLLLSGLDQYFAGAYEQAINIWTRALFLDRNHARARAYIERARSALAERQRENEELLHAGVAAFHRGEGDQARRLLQAAMQFGAPSGEALAVLNRLTRLEQGTARLPTPRAPAGRWIVSARGDFRQSAFPRGAALFALLVLVLVLGAGLLTISAPTGWRAFVPLPADPLASTAPMTPAESGLPLPRRAEDALARAHMLAASGRLRDALAALDLVRATDPQKADADRLRSALQRQVIELDTTLRAPLPVTPESPAR